MEHWKGILTISLVVVDVDSLQLKIGLSGILSIRLDSVLVGDDLPELKWNFSFHIFGNFFSP